MLLSIQTRGLGLLVVFLLLLDSSPYVASMKKAKKNVAQNVIKKAFEKDKQETGILKQRNTMGIDKFVQDFPQVEPGILEAVKRPLDSLAEEVGAQSRLINWVQTIARSEGLQLSLSEILSTKAPKKNNLTCPFVKPTDCSPNEKYRRVDGRCNNLNNPLWGAGFTPMARDVPAHYDSGIQSGYLRNDLVRKTSKNGTLLPSARLVSNIVHSSSATQPTGPATMAFVSFGQLTAHDVTDTAFERGFEGAFLDCCSNALTSSYPRKERWYDYAFYTPLSKYLPDQNGILAELSIRGCENIPLSSGDFFRGFGRTCLPFVRAKEVTDLECERGDREQLNRVSSFVDGSNMYGHTEEILLTLRGDEGQLQSSEPNHLPFQAHPNMAAFQKGINFMDAGDQRVSEVIGLIGVTTLWYREHNRVAQQLAQFPKFSSISDATERSNAIFEETRKIVVAFKQRITYNEFIRLAIGPDAMNQFGLDAPSNGYFNGYDPYLNPTMTNEVIVSAQRFGHSLLRSILSVLNGDFSSVDETLQLRKIFWRPNFYLLFENGFQRGVSTDAAEVCDRHITDEVRDHLFETENGNGEDLVARNIQRGRDHGVPSYNKLRKEMGLSEASTFTASGSPGFEHHTDDVVNKFQMVYGDPDDVDLFTGGISETPVEDGILGPLFSQMLGRQFRKLRVGDRFWFESPTTGFTLDQLNEIRKVRMSYLMCQNVDGLTTVQPLLFRKPTFGGSNDRVSCNDLPFVDLTKWL